MSETKKPSFLRRKYVINFKFQSAFIRKSFFIAGLMIISQYVALQYIFARFNIYGETLPYDLKRKFYEFLNPQYDTINQTFLVLGLITSISIVVWGLIQSHRIAGPLHNIKLRLKKISKATTTSDLTGFESTQFRRSDYFHELADEYNKALQNLKNLAKNEIMKNEKPETPEEQLLNNTSQEKVIALKTYTDKNKAA